MCMMTFLVYVIKKIYIYCIGLFCIDIHYSFELYRSHKFDFKMSAGLIFFFTASQVVDFI